MYFGILSSTKNVNSYNIRHQHFSAGFLEKLKVEGGKVESEVKKSEKR